MLICRMRPCCSRQVTSPVLTNRKPPYSLAGGLFDALQATDGRMYAVSNEVGRKAAQFLRDAEGIDPQPGSGDRDCGARAGCRDRGGGRDDLILLNITVGIREDPGGLHPVSPHDVRPGDCRGGRTKGLLQNSGSGSHTMDEDQIIGELKKQGIDLVSSVPCDRARGFFSGCPGIPGHRPDPERGWRGHWRELTHRCPPGHRDPELGLGEHAQRDPFPGR